MTGDTGEGKAGSQKKKLLIAGFAVAVIVCGVALGLGLGFGLLNEEDNSKSPPVSSATPRPAAPPSNTISETPDADSGTPRSFNSTLDVTPVSPTNTTEGLQQNTTDASTDALESMQDPENVINKAIEAFVDIFIAKQNNSRPGSSQRLQSVRGNKELLVEFVRARRVEEVLVLMRRYSTAANMTAREEEDLNEDILNTIDDYSLAIYLSYGYFYEEPFLTDKQLQLAAALDAAAAEELTDEKDSATFQSTPDAIQQFVNFEKRLKAAGFGIRDVLNISSKLGKPDAGTKLVAGRKMLEGTGILPTQGYTKFQHRKIGLVFHVFKYQFNPFDLPSNDNTTIFPTGSNNPALAERLITIANQLYYASGMDIEFYLEEYRSDHKKFKYLFLGDRSSWINHADMEYSGSRLLCPLAKQHNKDPSRFLNIFVIGDYDGYSRAFASVVPPISDSCIRALKFNDTIAYDVVDSLSASFAALTWDDVDPLFSNNASAYELGGFVLAHEIGHLLGLVHTHDSDTCAVDDELVEDTPPEDVVYDQPYYQGLKRWCNAMRAGKTVDIKVLKGFDSCRGDNYIDNVFNIMAYTAPSCNLYFTPGQVRRVQRVVTKYRPDLGLL